MEASKKSLPMAIASTLAISMPMASTSTTGGTTTATTTLAFPLPGIPFYRN
jgi:hypothetical protein